MFERSYDSIIQMDRLDDDMKALLKEIGIIEKSQVDNDTMEFIYDFVDRHGGANAVREDFAWHVSKKHHPSSESHTENATSITRRPLPALPPETKGKLSFVLIVCVIVIISLSEHEIACLKDQYQRSYY